MGRLRWIGIGLLVAATARCGYPDFQFSSGTGASGSTSSASASGSGGSGTSCHLLGASGCGAGQRCTIVDANTGATGCVAQAAKPLGPYDSCDTDTRCPASTWCDGRTGVCMPFCQSAADCHQNDCVAAYDVSQKTVPGGVSVCVADCDPVSAAPCGHGATCSYDPTVGSMDCFSSPELAVGDPCMYLNDCGPGSVCVGDTCQMWCAPVNASSPDCNGGECGMFTNLTPMYKMQTYGSCL